MQLSSKGHLGAVIRGPGRTLREVATLGARGTPVTRFILLSSRKPVTSVPKQTRRPAFSEGVIEGLLLAHPHEGCPAVDAQLFHAPVHGTSPLGRPSSSKSSIDF